MNGFVTFIRRTIGKDSEGFKTETETVLAENVRCYHEARHPSRRWSNLATFSEATDRFVIRCHPMFELAAGDLIDCGGRRYNITSAENAAGRGMYVEIYAERTESRLG